MEQLEAGDVIDSRFTIIKPLGRGAMGTVYLVEDKNTKSRRALKIPNISSSTAQNSERFFRELKMCAELRHPNLLTFHNFGKAREQRHYFTMEYIAGPTLRKVLKDGSLSNQLVRSLARQLLEATSALHEKGIIHRDIKPENIMFRSFPAAEPEIVLADLGLARAVDQTALTETGLAIGTPAYMSPEQIKGERANEKSDLFALSVVVYECLVGEHPFAGSTVGKKLASILADEPAPLDDNKLAAWDKFLVKGLAKNVAIRAQKATDLIKLIPRELPTKISHPSKKTERAMALFPLLCGLLLLLFMIYPTHETKHDVISLQIFPKEDCVEVSWESTTLYPSRIIVSSRDNSILETGVKEARRRHRLRLSGLRASRDYKLKIVFPEGNTSLPSSFKTVKDPLIALISRARTLRKKMDTFNSRFVARDAVLTLLTSTREAINTARNLEDDNELGKKMAQQRIPIARAQLLSSVKSSGIVDTWQEARELAPDLLTNSRVPFLERAMFYKAMSRVLEVYYFGCQFKSPLKEILPPDLGPWALSATPLPGNGLVLSIFESAPPLFLRQRLRFTNRALEEKMLNFSLSPEQLQVASRAELVFNVKHFRRAVLTVLLNNLPPIKISDLPQAFGIELPRQHDIYQRIPMEGLRSGSNNLLLKVTPLIGYAVADEIPILKVSLKLLPRESGKVH